MSERIFYGWFVVAGLFLILTVSSGFGFYNLSVYMNVLAAKTGFAISQLSVAVSLFFLVGGVAGMWVAVLLERFDVRLIMVAGAVLAGLSLAATGHAETLWQLYILYLLFGTGNAAVSIVTSTTLVTRWFPGSNRGVALSLASTGLSMGGVVLTPLAAKLFNDYGVVRVMPWLGAAFTLLMVPVILGVLRPRPDAATSAAIGVDLHSGWAYRDAVRSRFFLFLTLGYVLCMSAQVGGIAHLYNRAEGQVGYAVAAQAVQVLTIMSIVCRLVGGALLSRMSLRTFTLANLIGQSAGLAVVGVAGSTTGVLLGAALFGATVGNLLMLHPLWLAEAFGVKAYARIFSLSNALTVAGVAGGPVLLGLLHDVADYRLAYGAAAGLSMAALLVLLLAGPTPSASLQPESGATS